LRERIFAFARAHVMVVCNIGESFTAALAVVSAHSLRMKPLWLGIHTPPSAASGKDMA
jgi:hypothetical protein